jgi:hypothetical protein
MYYYHPVGSDRLVHERYEHFNNPFVTEVPNDSNSIMIVPETAPDYLKFHKKCVKLIWWMSVDNYFEVYLKGRRNRYKNIMGLLKYNVFKHDVYHLVQSYYAEEFLISKNVSQDNIFYLSDYVDDIFLDNHFEDLSGAERENIILYSPKRGLEFTEKLVKRLNGYRWVPLVNLTQDEMIDYMKKSKLYIDFGNHPGKDRIPREAAITGCCVITGKRGSAKNSYDVLIPESYKFDDSDADIEIICSRIVEIMENYSVLINDFSDYRNMIKNEKKKFVDDSMKIFNKLAK